MIMWIFLTAMAAPQEAEFIAYETPELETAACVLQIAEDGEDSWLEAWAAPELQGRYQLDARLLLPGGEADIGQEGAIESVDEPMGEIFIQSGAGFDATLRVYDLNGDLICEDYRAS